MDESVGEAQDGEAASCYMCDAAPTSAEHAPPKCLFPEGHRNNLITVPSCDTHNSEKSKDDEYMRFVISSSHASDAEGHKDAFDKALRGMQYRPHLFKEFFFKGPTYAATVNGEPTAAYTVDHDRLTNALEHTARAIYFHEFKAKWAEDLWILVASGAFSPDEVNAAPQNLRISALASMDPGTPKVGDNPDVFFYQFWTYTDPSSSILRMVFYAGFVVFALPRRLMRSLSNAEKGASGVELRPNLGEHDGADQPT